MIFNPYHIPPYFLRNTVWRIPNDQNTVFITFDDGPHPSTTPFILETLSKFHAKATFFCIGKNVDRYPELFNAIVEQDHAVGNHTYSHLKGWQTPNQEYFSDIDLAAQHVPATLFRPPYGQIKLSQIKQLKLQYKLVFWSVLSWDFLETLSPEKCLSHVLSKTQSGDIVVFHDSVKAFPRMSYALPIVLEVLEKKGYNFCPIK
jgi:peptidoglycan/xylan/chitin deacetylase (PgdA/CDA1 family)